MHQQPTAFKNMVGKGEIACNEQFLLFPQGFQLNQITVSPFAHVFFIICLIAVELEAPKIGMSCKELIATYISMGESNTILSAYTLYRHLQWYCSHRSICNESRAIISLYQHVI